MPSAKPAQRSLKSSNNAHTNDDAHALFVAAVKNTGIITLLLALALCILWALIFPLFLDIMTNVDTIKTAARHNQWFACLLPLAGAAAYWLDGIFFGLTDGTRIRNGMLVVAVVFFPASVILAEHFGNLGVWLAIYLLLLLRALVLGYYLWTHYLLSTVKHQTS